MQQLIDFKKTPSQKNRQKNHLKINQKIQRGFTLLELMIAIMIASLLAMATWISFSATNNANNNQTAVSDVRDNAFYILDRMEYMVRHAGFKNYSETTAQLFQAFVEPVSFPANNNSTNFNQQNDQFAIQMKLPAFNDQEMVGCTGATIPSNNTNDIFTLRLYTQGNAATTQLFCEVRRNNTTIQGPTVIAQNIGRFKVFYRSLINNGSKPICAGNWQSAAAVGNFSNVCAVNLALVVLSDQRVLTSVVQNLQIAPDVASQNPNTIVATGANNALAPIARFIPKTIQTRNQ
jgi:prepilin-type N-terminal cleavage/methylation domain-containing protein